MNTVFKRNILERFRDILLGAGPGIIDAVICPMKIVD